MRKVSNSLSFPVFAFFVCSLLYPTHGTCERGDRHSAVVPHVDERVELLSIVFRLAGNSEYNMNTLPAYSADIERHFAPYRGRPAVQMAHELAAKNGVGFDSVMAMAISLTPPPALQPLVPFTPAVPHQRWGTSGAEKFLPLLRDFYRDSKFAEFFAAHKVMYRVAETRFATTLSLVDFGWYPRFYGEAPGLTYHLILGMNNGDGNYGPRLVHEDGSMELFSVIGCWTHDDAGNPTYPPEQEYLATIIHEFNHSFVNPAVAEHWKDFPGAEPVFAIVQDTMRRWAYGDAQTMVDESLVRAAVIVYFQEKGEESGKNLQRIREEQQHGFLWMDELVDKLKVYEAQRALYPTFPSYLPQIGLFYRDLAPRTATAFAARCAHVVSLEPFPNHAQDVDASVRLITIVVDKRLDSRGYSINYGAEGSEHYPISDKPTYGEGGLQILLPVQLKPNQTYSFVLTPLAFHTQDGYPLENYTVEFKTR
jgi:hypothetical protein